MHVAPPPPHHLDLPLHTYWWMFVSCSIGRDSSWYTNDTHFLYTHFAIYSCTVNIHKNTGLHEVQIKTKHENTFPPTLQICLWLSCAQSLFALIYSCFKVMYTEANLCTSYIEDGPHVCDVSCACVYIFFAHSAPFLIYLNLFIFFALLPFNVPLSFNTHPSSLYSVLIVLLGLPISAALHALPPHVLASYSPRLPRPPNTPASNWFLCWSVSQQLIQGPRQTGRRRFAQLGQHQGRRQVSTLAFLLVFVWSISCRSLDIIQTRTSKFPQCCFTCRDCVTNSQCN